MQEKLTLKQVPEFELDMRNLVEDKHIKLSRSAKLGVDLKPNAHVRDELNKMINYPHTKDLTAEEREMLYKYRFNKDF